MLRQLLALILLCSLGSTFTVSAAQSDFTPTFCANTGGAYYRPNLFPNFTDAHYRLVLEDWHTGQIVTTLAESLPFTYNFQWSPDCHYLIGTSAGHDDCQPGLIIWDAVSGAQQLSSDGFCNDVYHLHPRVFWRADSSAAVFSEWYSVGGVEGSVDQRFIWYPATNQRVNLLADFVDPTFDPIVWDDQRGWLWTGVGDGTVAYDVHTGAQAAHFRNPPHRDGHRFDTSSHVMLSSDNSKVIVYGQHAWDGSESEAMTVYDIASGTPTEVNVERNGAGVVAMSPDNHYLVMGYTALRVWDLNNLPENVTDRLPIKRINTGGERITGLRFLDATIVEVTTSNGVSRWNVQTGTQIKGG